MFYASVVYAVFSVLWMIFACRMQCKCYPNATKFKMLLVALANLLFAPICMILAIWRLPLPEDEITEIDKVNEADAY